MMKTTAFESDALPKPFSGPSAWLGSDMLEAPDQWLYCLTKDDISDLETAAQQFLSSGLDVGEMTKDRFPLKTFGAHLSALKNKLLSGVGVEF